MKHELRYDEETGVIRERIIDQFTAEELDEYVRISNELLVSHEDALVLVDYTQASRDLYQSRNVREDLIEMTGRLHYSNERVALLVVDEVIRMKALMMVAGWVRLGKPVEAKCFTDEEQAINWLKRSNGNGMH